MVEQCAVCTVELAGAPGLSYCAIEGTCLSHCHDFVGHCTPVNALDREDAERLEQAAKADREDADMERGRAGAGIGGSVSWGEGLDEYGDSDAEHW